MSEISLGTWGLSGAYGPVTDELVRDTLTGAREAGVDTFDMAPLWGEGHVEELVGEYFDGARDEVRFITRAGAVVEGDELKLRFDPESLRSDCEGSLRRLRTDHIDVWLLHQPTVEDLGTDELFELMGRLKDEGKIRAWGVSARGPDEARIALKKECDALCLRYNLLHRQDLDDLHSELVLSSAGVLARSPLQHGLLSGRWTEYRQFATADMRKQRWTSRALAIRVRHTNALRFLVHDGVPNMTAASLRFVLNSSQVTTAILGARRPIQIKTIDAQIGSPPYLPAGDVRRIREVLTEAGALSE